MAVIVCVGAWSVALAANAPVAQAQQLRLEADPPAIVGTAPARDEVEYRLTVSARVASGSGVRSWSMRLYVDDYSTPCDPSDPMCAPPDGLPIGWNPSAPFVDYTIGVRAFTYQEPRTSVTFPDPEHEEDKYFAFNAHRGGDYRVFAVWETGGAPVAVSSPTIITPGPLPQGVPVKRLTPSQRAELERSASKLNTVSGGVGVGGGLLGLLGLEIGGTTICPPCGVVGAGLALVGGAGAVASSEASDLAADPPDPSYERIADADFPGWPRGLPDPLGAKDVYRSLQQSQAELRATRESVERADGARIANAEQWEVAQMRYAGRHAGKASEAIRRTTRQLPALARRLRAWRYRVATPGRGLGRSTVSAPTRADLRLARAHVRKHGLPSLVRRQFRRSGADRAFVDGVRKAMSRRTVTPNRAASLLGSPELLRSLSRTAEALGEFSREVEENPLVRAGRPPYPDG